MLRNESEITYTRNAGGTPAFLDISESTDYLEPVPCVITGIKDMPDESNCPLLLR